MSNFTLNKKLKSTPLITFNAKPNIRFGNFIEMCLVTGTIKRLKGFSTLDQAAKDFWDVVERVYPNHNEEMLATIHELREALNKITYLQFNCDNTKDLLTCIKRVAGQALYLTQGYDKLRK